MNNRGRLRLAILAFALVLIVTGVTALALPSALDIALERWRGQLSPGSERAIAPVLALTAGRDEGRGADCEHAGFLALTAGDPDAARSYLERAAEQNELSAEGWLALGDLRRSADQPERAIEAWATALELGAPALEVYQRQLAYYDEIADYLRAGSILAKISALRPADPAVQFRLALFLSTQEPDLALARFEQASAAPEFNEPARRMIQTIRRSALISEDPAYSFLEIGRELGALGEWEMAVLAFRRATEANPEYADAWAFLGEAEQQTGRGGAAALDRAYRLEPDSLAVNALYSLYWRRLGQPDRAIPYLERAAELSADNPVWLADLAGTLGALGRVQEAIDLFQRAIQLEPENPLFWRMLASFSIQNDIQMEETGLPAARFALQLAPEDPAALDLLGQAYLVRENLVLAERFLLRSLNSSPEYAPAHLHLGLLRFVQGDLQAAREHLQQARALAPESPTGEQAARALERLGP